MKVPTTTRTTAARIARFARFARWLPGVPTLAALLALTTACFDYLAWRAAHVTRNVDTQNAWSMAVLLVSCVVLAMICSALLTTSRRP